MPTPILKLFAFILYTLVNKFLNSQIRNNRKTDTENSNKPAKNTEMWLEKYKSNGAIKITMLKTLNCLGLVIPALGYLSNFFLIDSENFKLMKHL